LDCGSEQRTNDIRCEQSALLVMAAEFRFFLPQMARLMRFGPDHIVPVRPLCQQTFLDGSHAAEE